MKRELKDLQQKDFKCKIVKDLGLLEYGTQGKTSRYAIFQCSKCHKEVKARPQQIKKSWIDGKCRECRLSESHTKYKFSNKKLLHVWHGMNSRCKDSNNIYYGNKGIKILFNGYDDFAEWSIKNGWEEGLTIDRIDSDGDYSKDNCRWVDRSIQTQNTRLIYSSNTSGYRGVTFNKSTSKWHSTIKVNGKGLYLGSFNTAIEAGICYDDFVKLNQLHHTTNGLKA
jgi:hypothetical protein